MLRLVFSEKYSPHIPGVGVSSSTSQSSDKSLRATLNSIKEQPSGISMSYKTLYQDTLRSLEDARQNGISIEEVKDVVKVIIRDTMSDLYKVSLWEDGWNGYDACAPNPHAVTHAMSWVTQFFLEIMDLKEDWIKPNVTGSGDGEVVLGWRHDRKRLTIYIDEQCAEYVRSWGKDIEKEMDDGDADSTSTCQSLWKWLIG